MRFMLKENSMQYLKKISSLNILLLTLLFLRVTSSVSIAYYYQDLYSFAFAFLYIAAFIGALLKKKLTYLLAIILAAIDFMLGLTMTLGSLFYGALIIDVLILIFAVMMYRKK